MRVSFWLLCLLVAVLLLFASGVAGQPFVPPPPEKGPLPMLRWDEVPALRVEPARPWPGPMAVRLDVLVDGRPVPTVAYRGKTYLPVPSLGAEYAVRVTNDGPRRVVAVVSVDGLSVISGQPASEHQPGYVVSAGGAVTIKGWRRDLDRVAAFRFVDRADAYASRVGRPENVGVIGLVAIEEYAPPMPLARGMKESADAYARSPRSEVGSVGTEYGRDLDSWAYYVPFSRSANKRVLTIYYDTAEELRRIGVPVDWPTPRPFPMDRPFAPPPDLLPGR
jgi:hypothetical protein